jgi:enamine deaminase RidA (YjgF/YER057c/UK114 family)
LIFVAGQGGEDAEGNIHPDFRTQVRQAFENIKKALQEVELEMTDIAKLTTLIVDYETSKHQILTEESRLFYLAESAL